MVLRIKYQSFKARQASEIVCHPFILKEFNNRWFLVGKTSAKKPVLTFALDRIIEIDYDTSIPYLDENFNGDTFYKDVIGVTVSNIRAERIQFRVWSSRTYTNIARRWVCSYVYCTIWCTNLSS